MEKTVVLRTERVAHDGAAEANYNGKEVRVHGMLPGEEGVVELSKKHGLYLGVLKEIRTASPSRKLPEELHFLSCSPWQVMDYPLQVELKRNILTDLFGYYDDAPKAGFTTAEQFFGYRTKMEYSFCDREGDRTIPLSLAFHERGGGSSRLALPNGCLLASEGMNRVALLLTAKLRERGYIARDLKALVVRESKSDGKFLAVLYAKRETIDQFPVEDIPGLSGFIVFYSTEKSPASVPTRELWRFGDDRITETIRDLRIRYSWDSFFQNNVGMFESALQMMRDAIVEGARVLELYSGAGTIGLALADRAESVRGVEIVENAVLSANANARENGIHNYHAEALSAEKIDAALFLEADALVLDPPRAGLHPKLLTQIMEARPLTIVYLSCNPETQARDYAALKEAYQITLVHGFDFYPNTPHVESLLILKRRGE